MNIILNRKELLQAMKIATAITPSRTHAAILKSVCLGSDGKSLFLHASDLEVSVNAAVNTVRPEAAMPAQILVEAKNLHNLLKGSKGDNVNLAFDDAGKRLALTDESGAVMNLASGGEFAEFPLWTGVGTDAVTKVNAGAFNGLLEKAAVSASAEATRFAVAGILLQFKDDSILAVATDGHRISEVRLKAQVAVEAKALMPLLAVKVLRHLASETELEVRVNEKMISFAWETVTTSGEIVAVLLEKTFPLYEGCIPRDNPFKAKLRRRDLAPIIDRAIASADRNGRPHVLFSFGAPDAVTVKAGAHGSDAAVEITSTIPARYVGEPVEIDISAGLLKDFLAVLDDDEFEILLALDGNRQALFQQASFGYTVAPLKTDPPKVQPEAQPEVSQEPDTKISQEAAQENPNEQEGSLDQHHDSGGAGISDPVHSPVVSDIPAGGQ
jgi:DNA polymerase-3 subunit beta